jgi:hypothetical protein
MDNGFRQEVETQENLESLQRQILRQVHEAERDNLEPELMITFSADFQIKVDTYCQTNLYQKNHAREYMGWPWLSTMWQEEPFILWKRV